MTRRLNICIATFDIVGPIRNGGIGTAYYALALALARAGHRVTVLYGLGQHCECKTIAHWQKHYRKLGVQFVPAPEYRDLDIRGSWAACAAYRVSHWLESRRFDIIHFHEWRGIGYYALLAKQQGLALQNSLVCVGTHSPSFWHKEGMRETPVSGDEFEVDFLERESVRMADVVWSPSRHMLDWMKDHDWPEPRRSFIKQYIMLDNDASPAASGVGRAIEELVFFGRLETRKGLDLFCDALDRLAQGKRLPRRVLFLGKIASVDGEDSEAFLKKRSAKWGGLKWSIESSFDRDRALEYLCREKRLAVLPSRVDNLPLTVLECLGSGIPFISSDVGGIPEMVHAEDAPQVLFPIDPDVWARALTTILTDGVVVPRPAIPFAQTLSEWEAWHLQEAPQRAIPENDPEQAPARAGHYRQMDQPLVSVCITTRNRPGLLKQALASVKRQTYRQIEVVIVDDGSNQPPALRYLDSLEKSFAARRWKIVRQQNRYPGAARNNAARHATGKYVLFMDDDNIAKPEEVETLVTAIESSGSDLVTCFLDVFQGDKPPLRPGRGTFRWSFLGPCTSLGATKNCFGDTNCLIERRVFTELGGFTEDFGIGFEDWEFLAKAVIRGYRLQVVPRALVWYRQTGQGVNSTTAFDKNHMRALRPYLEQLSPEMRNLVLMAKHQTLQPASAAPTPEVPRFDHVRDVVVFGAGEGGRLAMRLADACGWSVPYIVDNNKGLWEKRVHGRAVKPPTALKERDFDLIVVASYAGKQSLFQQLDKMGFSYRSSYTHFLDPVRVHEVQHQVTL